MGIFVVLFKYMLNDYLKYLIKYDNIHFSVFNPVYMCFM